MSIASPKPRKAKKPSQAEIVNNAAQALVYQLESHPHIVTPWISFSELIGLVPELTKESALKAIKKSPAKERLLFLFPSDPTSPVVLNEDVPALVESGELLTTLARRCCSVDTPVRSIIELTAPLAKLLQKPVSEYWSRDDVPLPAGFSRMSVVFNKRKQPGIHDERFPLPELELSRRLIDELNVLKSTGEQVYPARLSELQKRHSADANNEMVRRAMAISPFEEHVAIVRTTDEAWVAFKQDIPEIIASQSFLRRLVHATCTSQNPAVKVSELAKQLTKTLQDDFVAAWQDDSDQLRKLEFAILEPVKAKKKDVLVHDLRFPLPQKLLAEQIVDELASLKAKGTTSSYPTTLLRVIELIPELSAEQALEALQTLPAKQQPIIAFASDPASPFALSGDVGTLAQSPELLVSLVHRGCSADAPVRTLADLTAPLNSSLRKAVEEYWSRAETVLPSGLLRTSVTVAKKQQTAIHDGRFPLPEVALAEKLLRVLSSQKAIGPGSYPSTWHRLIELTDPTSSDKLRNLALRSELFRTRTVVSIGGDVDAPIALTGDEALLADSPRLFARVFDASRSFENQVVDAEKMAAKNPLHPAIKPLFQSNIRRRLATKDLPAGFGAIRISKNWHFMRLSDIIGLSTNGAASDQRSQPSVPPIAVDPNNFASDFDAAFAKLDGKLRLPGYASLVDLRPALSQYPHDTFDSGLLALRQSGRYSLSVAEARFGLTEEERAACITVDHVLHLLVHKN